MWSRGHRLDLGFTLALVPYLLNIFIDHDLELMRCFCECMSYCVVLRNLSDIERACLWNVFKHSIHDQFWERRG